MIELRPLRIVTLPPRFEGERAQAYARTARVRGAHALELRTDRTDPAGVEASALAAELPLVVSERGPSLPPSWLERATWVDRDVLHLAGREAPLDPERTLWSLHADRVLQPEEAVALWEQHLPAPPRWLKHVEPLGRPREGARLPETRNELRRRFPEARVTVLAMGAWAPPFRAVLSVGNALDYLALEPGLESAPGQLLLVDAVRGARAPTSTARLGILGTGLRHSRSPAIHPAPFDRLDLPPDVPLDELLEALRPHYRGFAVTSPFKQVVAEALLGECGEEGRGRGPRALNTLVRAPMPEGSPTDSVGYTGYNTDERGAEAVFAHLRPRRVVALGDGGVTEALRRAAQSSSLPFEAWTRARCVRAMAELERDERRGTHFFWTWPPSVEAPADLDFGGAPVVLLVYGPPAARLAHQVRALGGEPVSGGARWFVAQARAQRELWASSLCPQRKV